MNNAQLEEASRRKFNMKIYPIYLTFTYDFLFFYAIKVMFMSEVCGFTNSEIVFLVTVYSIATVFFQFFVAIVIALIGNKNSAFLGNMLLMIFIILLMTSKNYGLIMLGEIFAAFGFGLKNNSEMMILLQSIPTDDTVEKNKIFSKINRKGYTRFCILSAISAILSGWLYNINPYFPFAMTLICLLFAMLILINFYDFEHKTKKFSKKQIKEEYRNLKKGYKLTIKSKRLRALILFVSLILSISVLLTTYEMVLLQFLEVSAGILGVLYAVFEASKGIFAKQTFKIEKKFKNRTLKSLLGVLSGSFIVMGVIAIIDIEIHLKVALIVAILIVDSGICGMSEILNKKYLNNFSNEKISPAIYSSMQTIGGLFRILTTFIGSFILKFTEIDYAFLIFGFILIVFSILISNYADGKLGLSPEQYGESDNFNKK